MQAESGVELTKEGLDDWLGGWSRMATIAIMQPVVSGRSNQEMKSAGLVGLEQRGVGAWWR